MGSYKKIGLSHEIGVIDTPPFGVAISVCPHFCYAPVTIVGGIKICPCLSVCLSVCPSVRLSVRCHAIRYRVGVINSSHSFQWIFLKPCISVVDILKMCMWVCGGARINFDKITAF